MSAAQPSYSGFCGNGAFTETLIGRCRPSELQAIDPSEDQLAYARGGKKHKVLFQRADAMALPFDDDRFDAAVMALVIFFVPDQIPGVAKWRALYAPADR